MDDLDREARRLLGVDAASTQIQGRFGALDISYVRNALVATLPDAPELMLEVVPAAKPRPLDRASDYVRTEDIAFDQQFQIRGAASDVVLRVVAADLRTWLLAHPQTRLHLFGQHVEMSTSGLSVHELRGAMTVFEAFCTQLPSRIRDTVEARRRVPSTSYRDAGALALVEAREELTALELAAVSEFDRTGRQALVTVLRIFAVLLGGMAVLAVVGVVLGNSSVVPLAVGAVIAAYLLVEVVVLVVGPRRRPRRRRRQRRIRELRRLLAAGGPEPGEPIRGDAARSDA